MGGSRVVGRWAALVVAAGVGAFALVGPTDATQSRPDERPTAAVLRRQCAGVGTLATFVLRNPTDSLRRFHTRIWPGDGSGAMTKTLKVQPGNQTFAVQIGSTPADALIEVGRGHRTVLSQFVKPLPGC